MGKHWARQQVKQDELQDTLAKGVKWALANRQTAGIGAVASIALLLFGGLALHRWQTNKDEAWDRLGMAQALAFSGNPPAALQQVDALVQAQPGATASGFGLLLAGDMLYQEGKYQDAAARYSELLQNGSPKQLLSYALSDLTITQEALGQLDASAASARRFLDTYPDNFLAPQVHACLARVLMAQGKTDEAKATLQKIALQYPETSFAAWAQAQLAPPAPKKGNK